MLPCTFPVTLSREFESVFAAIPLNRVGISTTPQIQRINFSNACFLPVNCLINREGNV